MKYTKETDLIKFVWNVKTTLRDAKTGKVKEVQYYHNLVTTIGKTLVAEFLGLNTPSVPSLRPNYCAVGTGTNAPALTDTQLQTELDRTTLASNSASGVVAYLTAYFGAADAIGTLKEAGLFINGSASANTGSLFNRVAINVTKSGSETLTIDFDITVS